MALSKVRTVDEVADDMSRMQELMMDGEESLLSRLMSDMEHYFELRIIEPNMDTMSPNREPTPGEWMWRFSRMGTVQRVEWIERAIKGDRRLQDDFLNDRKLMDEEDMEELAVFRANPPEGSMQVIVARQMCKSIATLAKEMLHSKDTVRQLIGSEILLTLGEKDA